MNFIIAVVLMIIAQIVLGVPGDIGLFRGIAGMAIICCAGALLWEQRP